MEIMRTHAAIGAETLRSAICRCPDPGYLSTAEEIAHAHHEWHNGKGYPNKLKGESIPLGARILAVADAYDAMTCARPYRPRLSNEEAVQALKNGAGKQWDPAVVDAFLRVLERESRMLQEPAVET